MFSPASVSIRVAALASLLAAGVVARPAAARRLAEASDSVARVTQLNRQALAAVDKREFEKAREILKKALELCDAAGLNQHPIAARTHLHMGVVILEGFKVRELGMKQFAAAIAIEPTIALTSALATPEMSEAFEEARAAVATGGESVAASGAPPGPSSGEAPPDQADDARDADHRMEAVQRPARAAADDDATQVAARGDDDQEPAAHRWFASLQVGGGFGTTSGHGELNADAAAPGSLAGALLGQLSPEVGVWVSPNLLLSGQARIQIVTGPTEIDANGRVYSPAGWAFALFARASWFFGSGALRPYVAGGLGGGQIRHVVTFGGLNDCGPTHTQTCVDTVVGGPALAEVGGGLLFQVSDEIGIIAGTNLQVGAPRFTANVDINAGVAFAF